MRFTMYRDVSGTWRWYLTAANGRKIANSGEGYFNKADCRAAIDLVKGTTFTPIYEQ